MKKYILILFVCFAACNSSKKNSGTMDAAVKQMNVPDCIKKMLMEYKSQPKQNPPRSIYSYSYNGKTVYYVPAICCDQFSSLYKEDCNLLGHPDGGFTGKGDGKIPDFKTARSNEKLIWADDRE